VIRFDPSILLRVPLPAMSTTLAPRLALFIALVGSACSSTSLAPEPRVHIDPSGATWVAPPEAKPAQPIAWSLEHLDLQDHGAAETDETAETAESNLDHDAPHASGPAPAHEAEHEHAERGTHVMDLFLGGTDEIRDRDGYTFGLDYGYHLGEDWGVGAFAEFVSGSRRSFAGGVMAFYHPLEPWFIGTGPGLERSEDEWDPIWRAATSWEIHIHEGLFIAPTLAYDWNTHDNVIVYGLSIGIVR